MRYPQRVYAAVWLRGSIMFRHILLPTDGSELSNGAAISAIQVAKALGARLTVFHGVPEYRQSFASDGFAIPRVPQVEERFDEEMAARADRILGVVKKAAAEAGVICFSGTAKGDSPYAMIIRQAALSKCDLIVMASHGRRGLQGLLLGSETQKVLIHSQIPVLVCR